MSLVPPPVASLTVREWNRESGPGKDFFRVSFRYLGAIRTSTKFILTFGSYRSRPLNLEQTSSAASEYAVQTEIPPRKLAIPGGGSVQRTAPVFLVVEEYEQGQCSAVVTHLSFMDFPASPLSGVGSETHHQRQAGSNGVPPLKMSGIPGPNGILPSATPPPSSGAAGMQVYSRVNSAQVPVLSTPPPATSPVPPSDNSVLSQSTGSQTQGPPREPQQSPMVQHHDGTQTYYGGQNYGGPFYNQYSNINYQATRQEQFRLPSVKTEAEPRMFHTVAGPSVIKNEFEATGYSGPPAGANMYAVANGKTVNSGPARPYGFEPVSPTNSIPQPQSQAQPSFQTGYNVQPSHALYSGSYYYGAGNSEQYGPYTDQGMASAPISSSQDVSHQWPYSQYRNSEPASDVPGAGEHYNMHAARLPSIATSYGVGPRPVPTSSEMVTQSPPLVRTTYLSQAASSLGGIGSGDARFSLTGTEGEHSPFQASLQIVGDLDAMPVYPPWSPAEEQARRRLIRFTRVQQGPQITAHFTVLNANDYTPTTPCVSCIYWEEKDECFITSVDCIYLLEQLVASKFTVEEKNRIRRNLEGYKPLTISKGKADYNNFFKLIMSFDNPKPRNIEKDVKVFEWKIVSHALKKIIGKYSADYSAPGGYSLPISR